MVDPINAIEESIRDYQEKIDNKKPVKEIFYRDLSDAKKISFDSGLDILRIMRDQAKGKTTEPEQIEDVRTRFMLSSFRVIFELPQEIQERRIQEAEDLYKIFEPYLLESFKQIWRKFFELAKKPRSSGSVDLSV